MVNRFLQSNSPTAGLILCLAIGVLGLTGVMLETPAAAGPPDPTPGATSPVREQNLDPNGLIRVHEQGIADVNVTNTPLDVQGSVDIGNFPTSIEVSNFPSVQDVEVVGGDVLATLMPATNAQSLSFQNAPDNVQVVQSFSTIDATTVVIWAFDEAEVSVALGSPLLADRIEALSDPDGDIGWRQLTFVHPLPINDVGVTCFNESDDCFVFVWVIGH